MEKLCFLPFFIFCEKVNFFFFRQEGRPLLIFLSLFSAKLHSFGCFKRVKEVVNVMF